MKNSSRGFTLLEVLIALAIVAVSAGALLGTVTSSASNVIYLKDKTLAEWVALNRMAEIRTAQNKPSTGKRMGATVMGGMRWEWEEEVTELPIDGMLRIEVRAHNTGEAVDDSKAQPQNNSQSQSQPQATTPTTPSGGKSATIPWTSTVVGVVGSGTEIVRTAIGLPFTGTISAPQGPPGGTPAPPKTGAPSS
jgi:general secretion pathway protein I